MHTRSMSRVLAALLAGLICAPVLAANVIVTVGGRTDGYYGGSPNLKFTPANVTIDVGDTVTFVNDGGFHNVVADDHSFRCALGCDGEPGANGAPSGDDWSAQVRFTRAGSFGYHCENHVAQGMVGSVVVRASTSTPIGGGFSGAWYNAAQSGHGFLVEVLPDNVMLVVWFVYSPDGSRQSWILAQGSYDPASSTVALPAYLYEGGRFPPNFQASQVTGNSWGTLTLSFADCSNGTASWSSTVPGYASGSMAITRLAGIAGMTCP